MSPSRPNVPSHQGPAAPLARLVDSLGTSSFETELIRCLHELAGAEHCVIYGLGNQQVELLGAVSMDGSDFARVRGWDYVREDLWRRDTGFLAAYHDHALPRAAVVRVRKEPARLPLARDQIYEKLFLYGARQSLYGISVLRNLDHAHFPDRDLRRLDRLAEVVLSCCDKHVAQRAAPARPRAGMASVAEIETGLDARRFGLTARERQVCSRLLYGQAVPAIAQELGIRPESVVTYKKRALVKAGVTTRHELLRQYLAA